MNLFMPPCTCIHEMFRTMCLFTDLTTKTALHSLLTASLIMKRFDNLNVVGLLRLCFDTPDGYPYLILPFMVNGNVRDYLRKKRVHVSNMNTLPAVNKNTTICIRCIYTWDTSFYRISKCLIFWKCVLILPMEWATWLTTDLYTETWLPEIACELLTSNAREWIQ